MERTFHTHRIRKGRECAPVWTLTTPDPGGLDHPVKVMVPGVWEAHPALRSYRGRGIYETTGIGGGNVRVSCGGVSFRARVYMDGEFLTEHYGAYTGFEAVVRDLPRGEHRLRVEVDNRFGEDSALHVPNDYYAYGGINRPVIVEELPEAYIVGCRVTPRRTPYGWSADAEVTVRSLSDEPFDGALTVSVAGQERSCPVRLAPGGTGGFSLEVTCGRVAAWSPERPRLYTVKTVLSAGGTDIDDLIDRIGFREIRVEGKRILLNGRPLRLKGFNRHEELGSFGLSVPLEAMMRDVYLMRDMGANCVRTCHYPNDPRFLDLCDEIGLLVWEESHARGFSEEQMRHPLFMQQLRKCTEEMVEQHYNHPCVFIWGCLNECADDTPYGAACYREILSLLRRSDSTRPATAALLERPGSLVFGDVDVLSVNMYPGWYRDESTSDALKRKKQEIAEHGGQGKPLIISEIGAGAVFGYHDPFGESKWSEERQSAILEEQLRAVLSDPDVSGVFIWQFADCRVDDKWALMRPRTYNNKGVVDEYRRPKNAYWTVKSLFRG